MTVEKESNEKKDRKQQIKEERDEIAEQKTKHQTSSDRARETLKKLKQNLAEESARQRKQVDKLLEENFFNLSPGSLEDRILQSEMRTPTIKQLEANITKLTNQIEWHRRKITELSGQDSELMREFSEIEIREKAEFVRQCFEGLIDHAMEFRQPYERMRATLGEIKALSSNLPGRKSWTNRLVEAGMSEWQLTACDSIMARLLTAHPLEFLYRIAVYRDTKGQNPFYAVELHKMGETPTAHQRRHDRYGPQHETGADQAADAIAGVMMEM